MNLQLWSYTSKITDADNVFLVMMTLRVKLVG